MSDHTKSWIKEYLQPRYPELVEPFRAAERIRDAALDSGVLLESDLSVIVASAKSIRTPLGENVAAMLGELADRFDIARKAVKDLAHDKKVHVRVNSLVALHSHSASLLHRELLKNALLDRSARVRKLAADKILNFCLRELLPSIDDAITREANPKVKNAFVWNRDLLRDGFRIERKDDGNAWITCRSQGGGTVSRIVPIEEVETLGREWIKETATQCGE